MAAISGGVVGAVAVLAVIAGAAYFCSRRRKSLKAPLPAIEQQTYFSPYAQLDGHEVKPIYETNGSLQNTPQRGEVKLVYEAYGSQNAAQQHRGAFAPDQKGTIELGNMSTRVELP